MSESSDEEVPLAVLAQQRKAQQQASQASNGSKAGAAKKPAAAAPRKRAAPSKKSQQSSDGDDEDDDDESAEESSSSEEEDDGEEEARPRRRSSSRGAGGGGGGERKRARKGEGGSSGGKSDKILWTSLKHHGVLFPPEYVPHGVKLLYEGQPVDLTPEQEEVATMFASTIESDYMRKPIFLKNFWAGFQEVLGKKHKIQSLDKCDFRPIHKHLMDEREKKKQLTKDEKDKLKKEKDAAEAKYKVAYVDGRAEPVGNFRVEPPSLFRGRGEHPKMGMIKKRIYPRDITINIGKGEPLPEHPYPGQTWKEVRHDQTVTWLAYWRDTVSQKDYKYVYLGATSTFKSDSDLAKYEKARKLKEIIGEVRRQYERDLQDKETKKQQMAVALYFIDKLALRAGHEKDEDEADTVGCCTLKVENVECVAPSSIKFDFLGKDSIRYENTVEVDPRVYKCVEKFRRVDATGKRKQGGDQLFESFDAQDLNKELKNIMDGLSVKVFRTYNASITLDRLLSELEQRNAGGAPQSVDEKKAEYDSANKEVAILCNHQRSVPKTHGDQMEKLQKKLDDLKKELTDLEDELKAAKKSKEGNITSLENKVERKKQQISKAELQARSKEDLKTVALGTSKINYMDPRITVAWCKRNEVPIEKIFNKSLLAKFHWCMDTEPAFKF